MPKYRVPAAELIQIVNPLDGEKWGCGPITFDDVKEAAKEGGPEEHPWQEVNGNLTEEENRPYHLRRIGTILFLEKDGIKPETDPNTKIRLIMKFSEEAFVKAWLYDGNHRVAAAFLRGDEYIDMEISSPYDDRIVEVLPGAELIEENNHEAVAGKGPPAGANTADHDG